jgi:hypothetical protein
MIVWLAKYCVSVWIRPDLSAWFPGSTHLIIASKMLNNREAEDLGFTAIAQVCAEDAELAEGAAPPK